MFLAYDIKSGIKYAKWIHAKRVDGKPKQEIENIGRVLDETRHIFQNRKRGIFCFDPATGKYSQVPTDFIPENIVRRKRGREKLLLDFGDVFLLTEFLKKVELKPELRLSAMEILIH